MTYDVVIILLSAVTTGFVGVISWFITTTLAKIDKNQTKLFDMVGQLSVELARLQGEHETMVRHLGYVRGAAANE